MVKLADIKFCDYYGEKRELSDGSRRYIRVFKGWLNLKGIPETGVKEILLGDRVLDVSKIFLDSCEIRD